MKQEKNYRNLFNGIEVPVELTNGQTVIPINFDNGATTPPLKQVDSFIAENILMYGSVGRGGHKSNYCTEAYALSKIEVLNFFSIKEDDEYEVIYVKNTTEGINLLANVLCDKKNSKILSTRLEHHANDLPWRKVSNVFYVEVDKEGKLILDEIEWILKRSLGTIKYVALSGASNVTGYIQPIHEIAKIVHKYGAYLIIDAAQLVAHKEINIEGKCKEEEIDFLVFSGHKMYAPFGSGVIIGKKELLKDKSPFLQGGGSVAAVFDNDVYYKDSWEKDEAGTPNFLGVMSIVAAMTALKVIGFQKIEMHEKRLKQALLSGLKNMHEIILYGDSNEESRLGVVSFNIEGMHHSKVGSLLQDLRGVAVRTGCFCAQPYVMRLLNINEKERYKYLNKPNYPNPGMIRVSLGLYNTEEEVSEFLTTIEHIIKQCR